MRLSRSGTLSVLLHAVALYGLLRADWHPPRPAPQRSATVVWVAALQPAPPGAGPVNRPSAAESTDGSERASPTERPSARARAQPVTSSPRAEPPAAPPEAAPNDVPARDLLEARRRATSEVVKDEARANAHRSFAFPGTIAQQRAFDESERLRRSEQGLQPPLTAFDSPAKGRAALPEERMAVYGVHWVSDDCYVFKEPLDRFILPGLFIEPTICSRAPRADLFVTAKPSYLMGDEARAAVSAETQRRERLRRPTTGAVMPFAKD
jgi:hypothetical protein